MQPHHTIDTTPPHHYSSPTTFLQEQVDREFLDTEIRALKEKLKEYERKSQLMGNANSELHTMLGRQKIDQKDIFQVRGPLPHPAPFARGGG